MALGRAGSWKISTSTGASVVAVPKGSAVPVFRAKRGWAPLATIRRRRWSRLNLWAVAWSLKLSFQMSSATAGSADVLRT